MSQPNALAHVLAMIQRMMLWMVMAGCLGAEPVKELQVLNWMVGTWEHESEGMDVRIKSRWLDGGKYLEREFEIKISNMPVTKMRQTVFWDPVKKQIRSWGLTGDGGFEEAFWRMKDGELEVRREITYPDGRKGKATNHWRMVDAKNCLWSSDKRSLDGKRSPDIPTTTLERM